jgi:hypothetical protein
VIAMSPSMNEIARRRRARNWALGGVLLGVVLLFYLVTIVRIGLIH